MSEIGQRLIGLVNADDQKQLAQVGGYFSEIVGFLEIREQANVRQMVRSLVAASQGDMASVYAMAASGNEIYQASDYCGIYTYNEGRDYWGFSSGSDSELILRFTYEGQAAEIKVTATGSTVDFIADGVTVKVPAKVTATITWGATTLTSVEITTANVSSSPTRKADITVNIDASGYRIATSVSVTPQAVKADYSINIKGTDAIKGEARLNGSNMTADESSDEDINNRFNDAYVRVFIMDEATVVLQCSSYKNLARDLEQIEDLYDNEEGMWGGSHEAAQATANVYKKYLNGNLTFGGSDKVSATLAFQPYIDYYEYWYAEPLLQFEDESLISFEDYFDAASGPFKSLADSFETLVRNFEGLME